MTPREEMALSIMTQLRQLGAWVVNPQPLRDERMRFEVLNDQVPQVLAKLGSWGWKPRQCSVGKRIIPSGVSAVIEATSIFELEMPQEKPPEPAKPGGELAVKSARADDEEWRKMIENFRKGK